MRDILNKDFIVFLLGLAGFIVTADNWVISPILPAISESFHISAASSGLLITAYMFPFGAFQIIMGPLSDRYGKKQVLTLSIIIFTITTGLCALGTNLASLSVFRALTGVFASSIMPISIALIGDMFPTQERQRAISTFMGISYLGQGLSMVIGGSVAYFLSWRSVFTVYAIFSLVPTILFIKSYKKIPSVKKPDAELFSPYLQMISKTENMFIYIIIFLEGMFIIGSFSYIGAYIEAVHHFNYLKIGLIMTGFGIMTLLGGRVGSKAVKITGPKIMVTFGLASGAASDLLMYYAGADVRVAAAAVALLGLAFILTHSTLMTRITELAQNARGTAMGLVAFCFMAGGAAGTAMGGKIVSVYDLNTLFLAFGTALLCSAVLSLLMIKGKAARKPVLANV